MTLTSTQRRIALVVALAVTIAGSTVFGDNEPVPVTEPAAAPVASESAPAAKRLESADRPTRLALEKLNRTPPAADGVDLFAAKSWYAPPPAQVMIPTPPPKPTAPPLPYSYVGKLEGKDGLIVFLARGDELLSAKPGAQLDKDYRLEAVSPEQLTFVYLPLGERQMLSAGGK